MIFVLKAAFHFGSFIYRSVSGMRPLSSVNNGSDNSKQFSFTLKFLSHCSIFVYFSDVFTFFLCLFIFSIREYSCNVSQTYLRVQKKNDCCIIFYCIFTLGNDVFLRFSQKNSKILGGFAPWTPTRALPWIHWGAHSTPQTPSWCFTCLRHVPFLLHRKPMRSYFFCIILWEDTIGSKEQRYAVSSPKWVGAKHIKSCIFQPYTGLKCLIF